jgi:hypothetical protein
MSNEFGVLTIACCGFVSDYMLFKTCFVTKKYSKRICWLNLITIFELAIITLFFLLVRFIDYISNYRIFIKFKL